MLTQKQFDVLNYLVKYSRIPAQRTISYALGISLGSVNCILKEMENKGYVEKGKVSSLGYEVLFPYKVQNAVIMAAGMGTRFAPLTYEIPKGLIRIKGEVLIERQIRQLKEAGIGNITVVVGYMQEYFFYLEEKFHVKIVINPDYYRYNNTSTLMAVLEELGNTYICSSDNYFAENVFTGYVYRSYYAAQYAAGATDEYCIRSDRRGRITGVSIGGHHSWYMIGQVYFSRAFSKTFSEILKREYKKEETKHLLWEDVYIRHIDELDMYVKRYEEHKILEFDSLEDLRNFDFSYVDNVGSSIMDNICRVLHCRHKDITQIRVVKEVSGYLAFRFICGNDVYLYLHPDRSMINRTDWKKKAFFLKLAKKLELNGKSLYIDEKRGWEVAVYHDSIREADYKSASDMQRIAEAYRKLHASGPVLEYEFNIWKETDCYKQRLEELDIRLPFDFQEMYAAAKEIYDSIPVNRENWTVCYNACGNRGIFLGEEGRVLLVDWSVSGNGDPFCDMASYVCGIPCSFEETMQIFTIYLCHEPSEKEQIRFMKYVAVAAFYWYMAALYKDTEGGIGELPVYRFYKKFRFYSSKVLKKKSPEKPGRKENRYGDTI